MKWTQEMVDALIAMRRARVPYKEIAKALNITPKSASQKIYYLANRKNEIAKAAARVKANPEGHRRADAKWKKANPEKRRVYNRKYYAKKRAAQMLVKRPILK